MDIGTLTGTLELDDRLTGQFDIVAHKVEAFASDIIDGLGLIGVAATVATTAIIGIGASIVALASKGSDINDVAESFDRLAGGSQNANLVLAEMRKGVVGTVTEMNLMTQANKLLQSGVKANAADFGTLTAVSRLLSREGFGPLETIMSQVDRAMQTGQTARLGRIGLTVNVKKAEEDLAKTLHVSVQELSPLGVLEAKRIAVLTASRAALKAAGTEELDMAERVRQTKTSIADWVEELERSIGTSTHVEQAFDTIKKSIIDAFGGTAEAAANRILAWVNNFADAVTTYGPRIIKFFVDTASTISDLYRGVVGAWQAIPKWIRDIGGEAIIATAATWALTGAFKAVAASNALGLFVSLGRGLIPVLVKINEGLMLIAGGNIRSVLTGIVSQFRSLALAVWAAYGPLILIPVAIVAIWEAWKIGHWESVSDFFQNIGLLAMGYSKSQREAMIATSHATDAALAHASALDAQRSSLEALMRTRGISGGAGPSAEPPDLTEESTASKAHKQAVKDLLETLRGGSKEIKVYHDVFTQLSAAERADVGIQAQLIPMYEKGVEARQHMTAAESVWYANALKTQRLDEIRQEQSLAFRHVTLDQIHALELQGLTQKQIATTLHVSTEALQGYTDGLKRATLEQRELNLVVLAGVPALQNYDSQLLRAHELEDTTRRTAEISANQNLVITSLKAQGSAQLALAENQKKYDEARGMSEKRLFIDSQNIERIKYENARREAEQEFKFQDVTVTGFADITAAHKISLNEMDTDFAQSNALRIALFERSQSKWFQMIDSIKGRFKSLGNEISGSLATLFFGVGNDIDGHLHAAARRAHDAYVQIAADGKHTASELANAFRTWRDAEDEANSTFAERFKSVWYSIKKTIVDVLNDILKYFTERFIVGLLKGMAGAKLGQGFGSMLGGGGGGLGSLLTGVGSQAGMGALLAGGASAATASSVYAAGGLVAGGTSAGVAAGTGTLAASGAGLGAGAGAGTAAGGGSALGFLSNPAFWTNPWTIGIGAAALLTYGIIKKGWFRGGEEGIKVNPARDRFLSQFAQYDTHHDTNNPPGYYGLASLLATTHGERLFTALTQAHKMKEFQTAEQAIAQHLAGRHIGPGGIEIGRITSIKLANEGAFVPPGVTQGFIGHGGVEGELIAPIDKLARMLGARTQGHVGGVVHNHLWEINIHGGVMDRGNVRQVFKEHIIPLHKQANHLDEDGYAESTKRAVG